MNFPDYEAAANGLMLEIMAQQGISFGTDKLEVTEPYIAMAKACVSAALGDLYRPARECCPNRDHVFDYGAHDATVEGKFVCLVEGCGAVLMPVEALTEED